MHTLRSQAVFNPMETTFFKRAHTGTCLDNGYDINSMAALSNLFKLNNQQANDNCSSTDLLTNGNQNLASNLVSTNNSVAILPSALFTATTTSIQPSSAADLLDSLKTSKISSTVADNHLIYDKLTALSLFQQLKQLQDMPAALFNIQNSATFDLVRTVQLASELNSSTKSFNQQSIASLPIQSNQSSLNSRPIKRQKIIPNPIQLTYSNLNPNNEQVQPLDLSIKSASSTNSERFILEPLNLSRSNSPEENMQKSSNLVNNLIVNSSKIDSSSVQIQNALCKKKKMMLQRAAELLKKSSCSSAPCSPSSIATSSPSDQPFDLDTSQSNQSNLEICLPINNTDNVLNHHLNQLNKKRKFSDSTFSLNGLETNLTNLVQQSNLPKLQAKRRNAAKQRKTSVSTEESIVSNSNEQKVSQSNQNKPSTIIIDAKNTFTCLICGEMFAFKDRLSKHIKSKHRSKSTDDSNQSKTVVQSNGRNSPNQKNYSCKICNRSFSRSDMLTRHSRVHSGLKPYTCNICKSEFTRSDHLATHKRTHSGEKPYKCSQCVYKACRRDMITRHMRTHEDKNKKGSNQDESNQVESRNETDLSKDVQS